MCVGGGGDASGGLEAPGRDTYSAHRQVRLGMLTWFSHYQVCHEVVWTNASTTVGPASGVLKGMPQEDWKPQNVAPTVDGLLIVAVYPWSPMLQVHARLSSGTTGGCKM